MGLLVVTIAAGTAFGTAASPQYSEQDAIAIAAQHPAFADLTGRDGWFAAAYDTHNRYGVWRVQFWNETGDDAGWADVSIERSRVYSWDAYFDSTPAQDTEAQVVIEQFVRSHPDIIELMPDIVDAETRYLYIDYDGWADYWGVWVDAGEDSLWLTVKFEGGQPNALKNPTLEDIYFPNIVPYAEWVEASQAEAVSLAFQLPEIAAALRGHENWQTSAEAVDADTWSVIFQAGEQTLAEALVNVQAQNVIEFTVLQP